ncbi:J domain-containing protein [Massilia forsythiae]|uniref:J domain-containing protein n=1 Tax=Massilia forsythiae TaxID=2728020 RepID=A0A7Z2ZT95_9BURK|nr:J domain-containing protein [Massilia forsythiae]QJD99756.1 J domain-containing protein [Massilia forsythiae]
MAKIHTHYDNLKVSRHAPQEVIRAAYKALSQKYHPDKNQGDERAARIMAIVNTAYNILSDPVRRKEHDDWIASEEWEVEWLESTHGDEGRERTRADAQWEPRQVAPPPRWRFIRQPQWWGGMLACFAGGAALVFFLLDPPRVLPSALAWGGKPPAASISESTDRASQAPAGQRVDAGADGWARPAGQSDAPPDVKALAVTQLVVPQRAPDCDTDLQSQLSPNGDPWPAQSGYIDGYPIGNQGEEMQVLVDNSGNPSPVLVKLYDLDRHSNVRHAYVSGRTKFLIDRLAAGKYEVRYQNILVGGARADCTGGRHLSLNETAAHDAGG